MENRSEGRFDEVWNLETMFSQLAKRSTRMQVSGIFKQLRTLVIVSDTLSKFWEDWECFIFQIQCMVSVLVEIIFYCAWLIILVWVNEPKPKETTVKYFALRHHRSIEECTRENGESLKQYTRIVLATEIFSWSCQVWLPAPKFSLTYQPPLIGVKIKRKVIFDSCLNESRFFFFLFCFMIVLCPEIHGVFLRSSG